MAKRQNTFLIKRSNVPGKIPSPGDLQLGELALNTADVKLYTSGTTENDIIQIGWDRINRTGDTVTGNFVFNGNVTITGNTISNSLTTNTISATTYQNLPIDPNTFITGFTYNNNTFNIVDNLNNNFNTTINSVTGLTVNGDFNVNGQTVFSSSTDNVVTIIGSGSTNPLFSVSGSSGELFTISDNLTGDLLSVNNINAEPILIVRDDNTVLFGTNPTLSLNTTINETVLAGNIKTLYTIPSGYTSSYFDYSVFGGNGLRAGNVMGVWSGTSLQWTEVSTNDIGNTNDFNIYMEMSGTTALLRCSATTYNWDVKSIVRLI